MLAGMTEATAADAPAELSPALRRGLGLLLIGAAILLTAVVMAPIALSSNDLIQWARTGLGLVTGWWPWLVFIALDAAAGVCVLLSVYCAARGKSAGAFALGVWVFAGFSARANYRHGIDVRATAPDAWWFFPVMSVLGPALLEATTWFVRREIQKRDGTRARDRLKFGLVRWVPVVGAPRDTYGAYRTALILQIRTVEEAIRTYHELCPDGKVRVVQAIRDRDVATAAATARADQAAAEAAARADQLAARQATAAANRPLVVARPNPAADPTAVDQTNTIPPTNHRAAAATNGPSRATVRAAVAFSGHLTGPTNHRATAIADAATIRATYPDGLPTVGANRRLRQATPDGLGWHADKASKALAAYRDDADLSDSTPPIGSGAPATGSGSATDTATP